MTSTDLTKVEESRIDILPPKQAPSRHAIAVLHEAAEAMSVAHQYATAVCATSVCPQRFRGKPDDGAAAILYGLEVGLSPAQALQRVVVIHGMPSLEARTMVGLLQARGYQILPWKVDHATATVNGWYPHSPTVFGTDPNDLDTYGKRINPDVTSTWTIERATQAGYVPTINPATGKYRLNGSGKLLGNEKYITDPQAMLKAKAQAEVARDLAPDVLMGIQYATEDLQSERWDGTISVEQPQLRNTPITVEEILDEQRPATSSEGVKPDTEQAAATHQEQVATVVESLRERDAAAEPVESRVSTETLADEAPAETPNVPQDTNQTVPAEVVDDEEIVGLPQVKVRQLFALLREGGIQAREDRLVIFRKLAERQDIGSTNDLTTRDLNKIVAKLKGWSDVKTIESDCAEIIWEAAQAEATAPATSTTEEN